MSAILAIAAGGALGAVTRHLMNVGIMHAIGAPFPYGILTINVLGSLLMGIAIAFAATVWQPSQELKLFLTVGFLGAFTTFSAFSLDIMSLWMRGEVVSMFIYMAASVLLSIAAVFIGYGAVWKIFG